MNRTTLFFAVFTVYAFLFSLFTYVKVLNILTASLTALGLLIGFLLPFFLDVLVPKMMDGSAKVSTTLAKDVISQGATNVAKGNVYTEAQKGSPLRSYPLLLGYALAAIFVISSTQNWFGRGFVLGLGLSLILDIFVSKSPQILRERWFSIFRTRLNDTELTYFVWGCTGFFGIVTIFALLA